MTDSPFVVVPEGQEAAVISALVGPIHDLEPICPLCGNQGAERVFETPDAEVAVPCFLSWCAAHGVHAPIREGECIPKPGEEKGGRMIRCSACGYWTHPSAFCRPTGPAHRRSAA